jgi:hypothetical protein
VREDVLLVILHNDGLLGIKRKETRLYFMKDRGLVTKRITMSWFVSMED